MKRRKRWILLLAVVLGLAWLYPINQSVSYDSDAPLTEGYKGDIQVLKETHMAHTRQLERKDLTAHKMIYFSQLYEQPWLVSDEPVRINEAVLK
jgi:hypothetical protein